MLNHLILIMFIALRIGVHLQLKNYYIYCNGLKMNRERQREGERNATFCYILDREIGGSTTSTCTYTVATTTATHSTNDKTIFACRMPLIVRNSWNTFLCMLKSIRSVRFGLVHRSLATAAATHKGLGHT